MLPYQAGGTMNSKNKLKKTPTDSLHLSNTNLYSTLKSKSKGKSEVVFIGEKKLENVKVELFQFNEMEFKESYEKHFDFLDTPSPTSTHWLNIDGLHDIEMVQELATKANLDRLSVRQLLDTTQRPKVEEYETYLFFSVKSILKKPDGSTDLEQISFVLGKGYVISFQEKEGDHFDDVRNRIRLDLGLIRKQKADYLLIKLLDSILDNYFETIEVTNKEVAGLEKIIFTDPSREALIELEKSKKMAEILKKSLYPFMEAINYILNHQTTFFEKGNIKYIRDLQMSCANAIEEIESTTRSLESLSNVYFASLSHKMNEIMKVLTTVATIFIPLTFIVGVYGMNFDNMPELHYRYGYFIIWGVMIAATLGMLLYFKLKKWL